MAYQRLVSTDIHDCEDFRKQLKTYFFTLALSSLIVRFYTVFIQCCDSVMHLCTSCNSCTINSRYDDDDGLTIIPW